MNDEELFALRRAWLVASNSTDKSIREREIAIRAMTKRVGKSLLEVTRQDLIVDHGREGIAPSTRAQYKATMYGFFTWLQDEGYRADNPAAKLPPVRVPHREPNPFTTEEIERLLASGIYRRQRLWVLLYAYQGFRAGEIAAVSAENIDWVQRRILTWEAKNGVHVWRPLHELVWEELQGWRDVEGWLFLRRDRTGHVAASTVSNTLSKAIKRAGIKHRAHDLRGWHATELIEAEVPTLVVAASMRHAGTQTVEKYAKVSDRAIAAAITKLPIVQVPDRAMRRVA